MFWETLQLEGWLVGWDLILKFMSLHIQELLLDIHQVKILMVGEIQKILVVLSVK